MKTALHCFAIAPPGVEKLVAVEIAALGGKPVVVAGGVEFEADAALLYRANLELRCASRVVVRIAAFRARTFFELERHAKKVPWTSYVKSGGAVALRVTARKSKLYHEGAIAERLLRAIEGEVGHVRVGVATVEQDDVTATAGQLFIVRFLRDECVVSADASGALLYMRGYRQAVAKAPLRETLAAAVLRSAGWDGETSLLDPMCGSGTIPIEAALLARRIAPGLASEGHQPRAYAFEGWPTFDASAWSSVVSRAQSAILPRAAVQVAGSDRDTGAVTAALSNAQRAGVADDVAFEQRPLSDAAVPDADAWLVSNPPYGVRVGGGDVRDLYAAVGRLARTRLPEGRVALLTPEPGVAAFTGLPLQPVLETRNGGIPVRLMAGPSSS
ncbi:MAG TPA: hypothetical protein VF035_09930 [Longimicrobiales bacterium]